MQPRQQIAYTEIGEYYKKKRDYGEVRRASAAPAVGDPRMQETGVGQPGDQRPDLLGIPAPVTAPRFVGPDSPRHKQQCKSGKRHAGQLVHQPSSVSAAGSIERI